jgi:hypothetical protein
MKRKQQHFQRNRMESMEQRGSFYKKKQAEMDAKQGLEVVDEGEDSEGDGSQKSDSKE